MKGGKTRIYKEFLDIFCQDSRKKSKKIWVERRGIPCVFIVLNENQNSSIYNYRTDYQHNTINTTFFQNSFQKLYRVIKGQCH